LTKEAVILGASVGAAGALMKTPTWARVIQRKK